MKTNTIRNSAFALAILGTLSLAACKTADSDMTPTPAPVPAPATQAPDASSMPATTPPADPATTPTPTP